MIILVPTDFSKPARVAVSYAAQLAKKMNASLKIIHVVYGQASSRAIMISPRLEEEMIEISQNDLRKLIEDVKKEVKGKLNITGTILRGFPVSDVIQGYLKKDKADLVVMGSQGATGLKTALIGTNAAALVNQSPVPVIVVPRLTSFSGLKRIVYATDLTHINEELKLICEFAKLFNATVDIIHVIPEEAETTLKANEIKDDLIAKMNYPKISFRIYKDDNVPAALDNFMIDRKADLLAMFTHKLSFVEKIFSRSVTRKIVFHTHIPLISFNKTLLK